MTLVTSIEPHLIGLTACENFKLKKHMLLTVQKWHIKTIVTKKTLSE